MLFLVNVTLAFFLIHIGFTLSVKFELLTEETPFSNSISVPKLLNDFAFANVESRIVTLPSTYIAPPAPKTVRVSLNLEFLTTASMSLRYIAPPSTFARQSLNVTESIVALVELYHAIDPPLSSVKSFSNVKLYNVESLQLFRDIDPPCRRASFLKNSMLEISNPVTFSQ